MLYYVVLVVAGSVVAWLSGLVVDDYYAHKRAKRRAWVRANGLDK